VLAQAPIARVANIKPRLNNKDDDAKRPALPPTGRIASGVVLRSWTGQPASGRTAVLFWPAIGLDQDVSPYPCWRIGLSESTKRSGARPTGGIPPSAGLRALRGPWRSSRPSNAEQRSCSKSKIRSARLLAPDYSPTSAASSKLRFPASKGSYSIVTSCRGGRAEISVRITGSKHAIGGHCSLDLRLLFVTLRFPSQKCVAALVTATVFHVS
jgi:hypothetical protein